MGPPFKSADMSCAVDPVPFTAQGPGFGIVLCAEQTYPLRVGVNASGALRDVPDVAKGRLKRRVALGSGLRSETVGANKPD